MQNSSWCGTHTTPQCTCGCCDCYEDLRKDQGQVGRGKAMADSGQNQTVAGNGMAGPRPANSGHQPHLSYDSADPDGDHHFFGPGWRNGAMPRARFHGDNVEIEGDAGEDIFFEKKGDGYEACYFVRDQLRKDGDDYVLTDPEGTERVFDSSGNLTEIREPGGNTTTVTTGGSGTTVETTVGAGPHAGKFRVKYAHSSPVSSVVLELERGGTTTVVRNARYGYTAGGRLEKVVVSEGAGTGAGDEIETTGYRYDAAGRLEYVIGDHAWRMLESLGLDPLDPATDVSGYADTRYGYFEAGEWEGKLLEVATHGGKYVYGPFAYANSPFSGATLNVWMRKTTVPQPDGTGHVLYFNRAGGVMLRTVRDARDPGDVREWHTHYRSDDKGRMILGADPSAVASVDEGDPGLVTLREDGGRVRIQTYTDAGYVERVSLQRGENEASRVKLREYTYEGRTANGITIRKVASDTVFRSAADGGSDPAMTEYAYDYHGTGYQVSGRTTTLPVVPSGENGDGVAATREETFDIYGFRTGETDENGTVTRHEYDPLLGARLRMVRDEGTNPPPPGRADYLNLTTDYLPDNLARTVRELGPAHEAQVDGEAVVVRTARWTQYLDTEEETRMIQGYVLASDEEDATTVNPVRINYHFEEDNPSETEAAYRTSSVAAVYDGGGVPEETHVFAREDWRRWSSALHDHFQERTGRRVYHRIPASGDGSEGPDYGETRYGYDEAGRQDRVVSPEGTVTRSRFNAMGWNEEVTVGTDDGASGNMLPVQLLEYDGGADGGDGNLTRATAVAGGGEPDRVVEHEYDWRDRLEKSAFNDGARDYITTREYDNRDNVRDTATYHDSVDTGNLIARSERFFDARNRVYRTEVHPDDGGQAQVSQVWYDPAGNSVRSEAAGSEAFSVTAYDALDRPVARYVGYDPESPPSDPESPPSDPSDIGDAIVMEQSETTYDGAGNAIETIGRQRIDDATGTGPLKDPSNEPEARVSYGGSYPDPVGRTLASVTVGTNGEGGPWNRPADIPPRTDNTLVVTSAYDDAADLVETADPMGIKTCFEHDDAGRRITVRENCVPGGGGNSSSGQCVDENRTSRYRYNLENRLTGLILENASTGNQETVWAYGVTEGEGSAIESNSLLSSKTYPDGGVERYEYNRQGQPTGMSDPAETVHAYSYDELGRGTGDEIVSDGGNIDTTIHRIERAYDAHLRLAKVSSIGKNGVGADKVMNEVALEYNAYGQLTADIQEHAEEAVVGSFRVGYLYHDGSGNTTRPEGMVFPDGEVLGYEYEGTPADKLGRIDRLTLDGDALCDYTYLGMGTPVTTRYLDLAAPPATVALGTFADGGTSDSGDKYTGLDRFGRIAETLWKDGAGTPATLQNAKYGYNRASDRKWRQEVLATGQDNFYWYDDLHQVKAREMGDLDGTAPDYTGIGNPPVEEEDFCYDETGNWLRHDNKGMAGPDPLFQQRQHNRANEITTITNPTGVAQPVYDPAGNMTILPALGDWDTAYEATWDGWNRPVRLEDASGVIARYAYDGISRRITADTGESTDVRHFYYNREWRCVEEYLNDSADDEPDRRYAWNPMNRWQMILRQRSDSGTLDESLYPLYDAMDPVALVDEGGTVQERYAYSAFGETTILQPNFSPRTGGSAFGWNLLHHVEFRDGDTGLYNYGFRYYHPELGRWLSRDPIGEASGANLVRFVSNDAVNLLDFIGLENILAPGNPHIPIFPIFLEPTYLDEAGDKYFGDDYEKFGSHLSRLGNVGTGGLLGERDTRRRGAEILKLLCASMDTMHNILAHSAGVQNVVRGILEFAKCICACPERKGRITITINILAVAPKMDAQRMHDELKAAIDACPKKLTLKLHVWVLYNPKDKLIPKSGFPPVPGNWNPEDLKDDIGKVVQDEYSSQGSPHNPRPALGLEPEVAGGEAAMNDRIEAINNFFKPKP